MLLDFSTTFLQFDYVIPLLLFINDYHDKVQLKLITSMAYVRSINSSF